jgi:hypothetical protein
MQKPRELQFLPQVILYLINVYEPCDEKLLLDMLSGEAAPKGIRGNVSVRILRSVMEHLQESKLVIKTAEETYCVTERGLERLAKVRVAFPRDKFRLYFIKDALKVRGR